MRHIFHDLGIRCRLGTRTRRTDSGGRRIWRDYEDKVARLAQGLLDSGLGHNSKVGIPIQLPEYAETNFAAMKIGGVPINVTAVPRRRAHYL